MNCQIYGPQRMRPTEFGDPLDFCDEVHVVGCGLNVSTPDELNFHRILVKIHGPLKLSFNNTGNP